MVTAGWYGDATAGNYLNNQKGESYAVDDCCGAGNFVVTGVSDQLHDGRVHSRHTGDCHYCCGNRLYSGAENVVAIWSLNIV